MRFFLYTHVIRVLVLTLVFIGLDYMDPNSDGSCPESYVKQGSLNSAPPENICGEYIALLTLLVMH